MGTAPYLGLPPRHRTSLFVASKDPKVQTSGVAMVERIVVRSSGARDGDIRLDAS